MSKNSSGLWKLSPSGLYDYTKCQSCFWVNCHFHKAPSLPLLLNSAMDSILKSRYDKYRMDGSFPPETREFLEREGIKPFSDIDTLNIWRSSLSVLSVINEVEGYILQGKIDDVLVGEGGYLVPTDYKSSGNAPSEDKQKYYLDQLAAYGLMFQKHGHEVRDFAYLLHYFVRDKTDGSVEVKFDSYIDKVPIDCSAIEKKLSNMVALLNNPYPGANPECPDCSYYLGRIEITEFHVKSEV